MNATTALIRAEAAETPGLLRRAGRVLLGSAAILVVGAGAVPAGTGVASGLKLVAAQHSNAAAGVSPSALPSGSRASAARFAVGKDGSLSRAD